MHFRTDAPHSIDLTHCLRRDRFDPGGNRTLPYCASRWIGKLRPIESTTIPNDRRRSPRSIEQKPTTDPSDATA
eukprot:scaffold1022_cov307-Pavlova_lutheri.AAC.6